MLPVIRFGLQVVSSHFVYSEYKLLVLFKNISKLFGGILLHRSNKLEWYRVQLTQMKNLAIDLKCESIRSVSNLLPKGGEVRENRIWSRGAEPKGSRCCLWMEFNKTLLLSES